LGQPPQWLQSAVGEGLRGLFFLGEAGEAGKEGGKMCGIRGEDDFRIHRLSGSGMVAIEDDGEIGRNYVLRNLGKGESSPSSGRLYSLKAR
jgi:hypothetical protein